MSELNAVRARDLHYTLAVCELQDAVANLMRTYGRSVRRMTAVRVARRGRNRSQLDYEVSVVVTLNHALHE